MAILKRFMMAGAVAALGQPCTASAQDPWLLRIAAEFGGDELVEVQYDSGEADTIEGGGRLHIETGKQLGIFPEKSGLSTELTAGYKFDSVKANNGDIRFTRFTLNAVQYFSVSDKLKLGGGVTYHISPTISIDVQGINDTRKADNAFGFLMTVDYALSEKARVGMRGTLIGYLISYSLDDLVEESGSSLGLYVGRYF